MWVLFWFTSAILFNIGIYWFYGSEKALEFLAGYLVEESLSIDNLFVFLLIFSYFNISLANQHRVLFWGIIGALVLRALFIFGGVLLVAKFHWLLYIFGIILLLTGVKILSHNEENADMGNNFILKYLRKLLPIANSHEGNAFLIKREGKILFTPLFVVLLMIEFSDIVFAMDSLPAIFAITLDPFIIYTSNIFAVLGLRSMYFVLANMMILFCYLKYGVAATLLFIGSKILIKDIYSVHIGVTLGLIVLFMGLSVIASIIKNKLNNA